MTDIKKDMLFEHIKDSSLRVVEFNTILDEQYNKIRDIERQEKPSKAATAYAQEEQEKLLYLQHKLKQAIWQAYGDADSEEIVKKTENWRCIKDNFDILVVVRSKK